jgi:hypothetical protein
MVRDTGLEPVRSLWLPANGLSAFMAGGRRRLLSLTGWEPVATR